MPILKSASVNHNMDEEKERQQEITHPSHKATEGEEFRDCAATVKVRNSSSYISRAGKRKINQ